MWPFKKRAVVDLVARETADDESSSWGVGGPSFLAMPPLEDMRPLVAAKAPPIASKNVTAH
jgi:hypothetical protein